MAQSKFWTRQISVIPLIKPCVSEDALCTALAKNPNAVLLFGLQST